MEQLAGAGQPVDFSLIALFARASLTVQIVMVILILASFWAWAIIIQKFISFNAARREADRFDRAFWSGQPLDDLYDRIGETPSGPAERIFSAGMAEWRRSHRDDGNLIAGVTARIDRAMNVTINRENDRLTRGLPFLATVGSTAPFIGLFGTVWGIKTAFEEIAISQNTSLAVVAPGIAEALVATALGLLAAIPAVIFYNKLSSDADRITGGYETFADEFSTILSRQLDDE
ncbi:MULTISPECIES: protein TolQ [Paracoccus]|jgi:biopolymer transport protein TolQ|uniref:Tol-Pal system protein TolQ n=1 Tax=Paracoccus denitrificans (strain Pd 1222) TaxID=318586 RepID=A1AZV1_PARDP|nr:MULTISPECIES: protein TolQ [Paracoccus]ABL68795.1 Cell division and transport-associated protein TolQ [Paracoccus denitrificans PD1222]MBB4625479.1 biopolymer transport protein TolQ [Paracoccus denitrificans]MCU7427352.1 protein TolQ [Paracoccus denitrificans]MDK8872236.1 protein TolQ [Paracoccus sp. SSJ]QAR26844.1 protein TolQ [Paracoccus denitrificans]